MHTIFAEAWDLTDDDLFGNVSCVIFRECLCGYVSLTPLSDEDE